MIRGAVAAFAFVFGISVTDAAIAGSDFACERGATLASGRPDPILISDEASKDVRAFWCERYDANGITKRIGAYRETYSSGGTRAEAEYVESRLQGPISIWNEDGSLFLRGFLEDGDWSGLLEIFHETGAVWFEAHFESGLLDGALRTHFPDGGLQSETRFQAGREDGLARSFYPTASGGRLRSEAHVEADQLVGPHRLLSPSGELLRVIDQKPGPTQWHSVHALPAAADTTNSDGVVHLLD